MIVIGWTFFGCLSFCLYSCSTIASAQPGLAAIVDTKGLRCSKRHFITWEVSINFHIVDIRDLKGILFSWAELYSRSLDIPPVCPSGRFCSSLSRWFFKVQYSGEKCVGTGEGALSLAMREGRTYEGMAPPALRGKGSSPLSEQLFVPAIPGFSHSYLFCRKDGEWPPLKKK